MQIVVTDLEGVLVDGEFLPQLAKLVDKEAEVAELTLRGIRGEVGWEEGLRQRIDLLKGIEYEDVLKVARSIPLMKNASKACEKMRKLGYRVVVISGGFDILIDRFKKDLVFDSVFSNKMIFKDNMLFDIEMNVTSNKAKILKGFMGENREECKEPDLKIAFNAQPIVKKYADVVINEKDLLEIIPHLQNCRSSLDNPLSNLVAIVDGTNDLALFGVYKYTSDL